MPLDRSHGIRVRKGSTTYTIHGYTLASDTEGHGIGIRTNGVTRYFDISNLSLTRYHIAFRTGTTTRYIFRSQAILKVTYNLTTEGSGPDKTVTKVEITKASCTYGITTKTTIKLQRLIATSWYDVGSVTYNANRTAESSYSLIGAGSRSYRIQVTNGSTTNTYNIEVDTSSHSFIFN